MLEAIAQARIGAVASELVLHELLVAPLKKGTQDAADEIELTLLHFPNLQLVPVTRAVLVRAAEIRAQSKDVGSIFREAHSLLSVWLPVLPLGTR